MKSFLRLFFACLFFFVSSSSLPVAPFGVSDAYAQSAQKAKPAKKKTAKKSTSKKRSSAQKVQRDTSSFTNDARFAALVVDARTGNVLYEKNSNGIRHPASLTKMMTLYLTFEALKSGRWRMDSTIPISVKAAAQPQTNINLLPGDRIPVQTAIDALIVRSANDVAMAIAEALGETQFNFAIMMNNKARQLGMRNTTFHNPSGLPDARQITTAVDLAKLAIALRRDFPEYYPYFSHTRFSFQGRTYEGHNRLLGRYPGADGVKTGFINASGFNLVTSVKRGNTSLVGVIMGGRTGAGRDQEMMSMLDRTFIQLAQGQAKTKPVPALAVKPAQPVEEPAETEEVAQEQAPATQVTERLEEKPVAAPAVTSQRAAAKLRNWSIQVGMFPQSENAREAVASARQIAQDALKGSKALYKPITHRGKKLTMARLTGLSAEDAKQACAALSAQKRQCLMVRGGK